MNSINLVTKTIKPLTETFAAIKTVPGADVVLVESVSLLGITHNRFGDGVFVPWSHVFELRGTRL